MLYLVGVSSDEGVRPLEKKRLRNITWDDYGISKNRYTELKAFCLQYDEKKSKITRGINNVNYDGMPKGNYPSNPMESQAIRNIMYQEDCEMIEQAAIAASEKLYPYILKSVTNNLSYQFIEYDEKLGRIPVGKTEFYGYRRLFYHYLDLVKSGDKLELLS